MRRKEAAHNLGRLMRIASLQGAADDDIGLLSCQNGKRLVKIEIVAGEEGKTNALQLQNIRRLILLGIVGCDPDGALKRRYMPLEILTDKHALAVISIGCVAVFPIHEAKRVDENDRAEPLCGFLTFFQQGFDKFFMQSEGILARCRYAGNVAVFGKNNNIHRPFKRVKTFHFIIKQFLRRRKIAAVRRLNHASSHHKNSIVLVSPKSAV